MEPKLLCGLLLTLVGLVFSSFCFIYAVMNPWNYNGINGLLGSFLGTQTLVPFIISTAAMCAGLILCFYVAFHKDNKDKATPHNSRLTAQAPLRQLRHGICVAKMLDKTSSIICAFGLASAAPRSPYRHLELCGIAINNLKP